MNQGIHLNLRRPHGQLNYCVPPTEFVLTQDEGGEENEQYCADLPWYYTQHIAALASPYGAPYMEKQEERLGTRTTYRELPAGRGRSNAMPYFAQDERTAQHARLIQEADSTLDFTALFALGDDAG